ncbi:UNVERIFIED_CONTAM: hypothetical protein GTU68_028290 [Idotea baltica]|nr:hypothetical protein [Idotea baltica]
MNDIISGAGELAYIAGWGALNDAESGTRPQTPTLLQAASVTTQSRSGCDALPGLYLLFDAATQICASVPEGGVDTCSGDSGGPFYTVTKENTLRLTGVTSWGEGCAVQGQPGIYTDVFAYSSWITQNIGGAVQTSTTTADELVDERFTSVGTRASTTGIGASILFMPILMLLLCIRFKPFVLFRR